MQEFTNLKIWQKAHNLTINVYKLSSEFPESEKFGLVNQIRRASISIESNIAEGAGRDGDLEFNRFLNISKGSCYEVQCQLYIARDLNYISAEKCSLYIGKIDELLKMITAFQKKLKTSRS